MNDKYLKKINNPILVLDMGINGLALINKLKKEINDDIVYLNDLECDDYEGKEQSFIDERIANLIIRANAYNPKVVIIANDTLIEYGKEKFEEAFKNVALINIVDEIISYVNIHYEFKNMAFFAPDGIIEFNMYQRNFSYTRLYNLSATNLMEVLNGAMMKTSASFNQMKVSLAPIYKKEIDVIIPTLVNLLLFKTEIYEYTKASADLLPIDDILTKKALSKIKSSSPKPSKYVYLDVLNTKEKQMVYNKILNVPFVYLRKLGENDGK